MFDDFRNFLNKNPIMKLAFNFILGAIVLTFLLIFWPLTIVDTGHVGVVSVFQKVEPEPLSEGLHIINPFARVKEITTQVQKVDVDGNSASKDLQTVHTVITLSYHINPTTAPRFHQHIGKDYANTIMRPLTAEVMKAATAHFTAEELIAKRDDVRNLIKTTLAERLMQKTANGIILDDFSIVNFKFSPAFDEAIEAKQVAEQNTLKAARDLQRIEIEAKQKIATAEAEAASLKAQKQEVTVELIELRKIEATREAVKKWDGHLPQYTGGALPFLNLGQASK